MIIENYFQLKDLPITTEVTFSGRYKFLSQKFHYNNEHSLRFDNFNSPGELSSSMIHAYNEDFSIDTMRLAEINHTFFHNIKYYEGGQLSKIFLTVTDKNGQWNNT